jgi:L,D-transpeptidase ErfK/SrfK
LDSAGQIQFALIEIIFHARTVSVIYGMRIITVLIYYSGLLVSCDTTTQSKNDEMNIDSKTAPNPSLIISSINPYVKIEHDVTAAKYFEFMDSLAQKTYELSGVQNEYTFVHANPWLLDTLMAQDYYIAKERGVVIGDQKQLIILHRGDSLKIPTAADCDSIQRMLQSVLIDVNIPEFTLRIWLDDRVIHTCPVRVGKNQRKYLALARHVVDLRTPIGEGSIVRIERNPLYINPVDGHRYKATRRDDGNYTQLPRIPFLEPIIAGRRSGALIHPTTNRSTLGKAISNGCVGLSEADAWMVYYYAPLGTKVRFRYDLNPTLGAEGSPLLNDIYDFKTR